MSQVRAVAKYIRMAPQKVRLVADLVRGRKVQDALNLLQFTPKFAAKQVASVIASAAANAEENHGLTRDELYVQTVMIDEGPTLKRGVAGARGRYKPQLHRSSHITVILSDEA
ncbi:MAG: 50S ribosomal protein L22 [Chloroflexi bacterium]|nr:50S ribosomal protein L22 [Chloroflexota bacterium]